MTRLAVAARTTRCAVTAAFQQGTVAPDATYRWMGSVAIDRAGDMALGYSTSSSTLHPGIADSGRLVGDPAGTMPQSETTIFTANLAAHANQTVVLKFTSHYDNYASDPTYTRFDDVGIG